MTKPPAAFVVVVSDYVMMFFPLRVPPPPPSLPTYGNPVAAPAYVETVKVGARMAALATRAEEICAKRKNVEAALKSMGECM